MMRWPLGATLFPSTTLFRSIRSSAVRLPALERLRQLRGRGRELSPFGAEVSACRLQPVDERFVRDGQIVGVQDQIDVEFGERGCEIVGGPDYGHAGDPAVSLSWIVIQKSDGLVARVAHAGDQ